MVARSEPSFSDNSSSTLATAAKVSSDGPLLNISRFTLAAAVHGISPQGTCFIDACLSVLYVSSDDLPLLFANCTTSQAKLVICPPSALLWEIFNPDLLTTLSPCFEGDLFLDYRRISASYS